MNISKRNSAMDLLRVIAALAVVVMHACDINMNPSSGNGAWWVSNFLDSASRWAVPVFFMLSGAFLIREDAFKDMGAFYKKRLVRLLIPLVFWSVFYVVWDRLVGDPNLPWDPLILFRNFAHGEPSVILWFLYVLLGLYLICPVIALMFSYMGQRQRWVLIGLWFVFASAENVMTNLWGGFSNTFFMRAMLFLPYFMLGRELVEIRFERSRYVFLGAWVAATIVLALIVGARVDTYGGSAWPVVYDYLFPVVIVQSVALFVFFVKLGQDGVVKHSPLLERLSSLTLGVYLSHILFLNLYRFAAASMSLPQVASVLLKITCVFVVTMWVCSKVAKVPYLRRIVS